MPQLRTPDGKIVVVPDEQVGLALSGGYTPVSVEQAAAVTSNEAAPESGPLGAVGAAATSALSGTTLGLSDIALKGLVSRGTYRQIAADREAHPYVSTGGQIAGAIAGAALSGGAATPVGFLSSLTAEAAEAGGLAGYAATGVEGAIQNAGIYLSDTALGDRDATAQGVIGALGTGFGFGVGGAALAHGVEAGTIAARRMFSRVMEGGDKAAADAAAAWQRTSQEVLEAHDQTLAIAEAQLAAARGAREQAGVASQQAAVGVAETRLGAPAVDAARAPLVSLDKSIGAIEDQEGREAAAAAAGPTSIPEPAVAPPGGVQDVDALRAIAAGPAPEDRLAAAVEDYKAARTDYDTMLAKVEMGPEIEGDLTRLFPSDVYADAGVPTSEFGRTPRLGRSQEDLARLVEEAGANWAQPEVAATIAGTPARRSLGEIVASRTPPSALEEAAIAARKELNDARAAMEASTAFGTPAQERFRAASKARLERASTRYSEIRAEIEQEIAPEQQQVAFAAKRAELHDADQALLAREKSFAAGSDLPDEAYVDLKEKRKALEKEYRDLHKKVEGRRLGIRLVGEQEAHSPLLKFEELKPLPVESGAGAKQLFGDSKGNAWVQTYVAPEHLSREFIYRRIQRMFGAGGADAKLARIDGQLRLVLKSTETRVTKPANPITGAWIHDVTSDISGTEITQPRVAGPGPAVTAALQDLTPAQAKVHLQDFVDNFKINQHAINEVINESALTPEAKSTAQENVAHHAEQLRLHLSKLAGVAAAAVAQHTGSKLAPNDAHQPLDWSEYDSLVEGFSDRLSTEERNAFKQYSHPNNGVFAGINAKLRTGSPIDGSNLPTARALDKAIAGSPAETDLLVYRGVNPGDAADRMAGAKVGEVLSDPAFLSATADEKIATEFAKRGSSKDGRVVSMEIEVPKDSPIAPVPSFKDATYDSSKEREFLLPRDTKLQVVGTEEYGKHTVIRARVVTPASEAGGAVAGSGDLEAALRGTKQGVDGGGSIRRIGDESPGRAQYVADKAADRARQAEKFRTSAVGVPEVAASAERTATRDATGDLLSSGDDDLEKVLRGTKAGLDMGAGMRDVAAAGDGLRAEIRAATRTSGDVIEPATEMRAKALDHFSTEAHPDWQISRGIPTSPPANPNTLFLVRPSEVVERQLVGDIGLGERDLAAAEREWAAGAKGKPLQMQVATDGRIRIQEGAAQLLAAARDADSPVLAEFSQIGRAGAVRDELIAGGPKGVASPLGERPGVAVDRNRVTAAAEEQFRNRDLRAVGDQHPLDIKTLELAHDDALARAAAASDPIAKRLATNEAKAIEAELSLVGARPGAVEDVAAMAPVITRLEKASTEMTEAVGPAAPQVAKDAAAGYRAAENAVDRKTMTRAAQAADDHADTLAQVGVDRRPGLSGKQRVDAARTSKDATDLELARAKLAESQARITARGARDAAKGARNQLAKQALAPSVAAAAEGGGGIAGGLLTAAKVVGIAGELGVPGIPSAHDIPVIGPILSAYLKYRALKAAAGRFVGRVPGTAESRAAALAARTKDAIARGVDRSLGLIATNTPTVRKLLVTSSLQINDALKKRLIDDGAPDAPKDATTAQLAAVRMREAAAAAANPRLAAALVRKQGRELLDPDLIAALQNHLQQTFQHLADTAPKGPPPNPFTGKAWEPTAAQALQWGRRLAVAQDPTAAIDALMTRTLTPEAADTMRVCYSKLFALAQQRLLERAADLKHPVDHYQLQQMSILFDVPLTPSQDPSNAAIMRSAHAPSSAAPAGGQGASPGPPVPSIASSTSLSSLYQTTSERRALPR